MATQLKSVDVAVIGLGAAGGVAVLPLARAGLKVAGTEAGTWKRWHPHGRQFGNEGGESMGLFARDSQTDSGGPSLADSRPFGQKLEIISVKD
jgi:choline dehydrogenase-like flavoprotein